MLLDDDVTDDIATRCQGNGVDWRVHEHALIRVVVLKVWLPVTVDTKDEPPAVWSLKTEVTEISSVKARLSSVCSHSL